MTFGLLLAALLAIQPTEIQVHAYRIPRKTTTLLLFDVAIPQQSLLFKKESKRFVAQLEIAFNIQDPQTGQVIKGDFFRFTHYQDAFDQTQSRKRAHFKKILKVSTRPAYTIQVTVRDLNAKRTVYEVTRDLPNPPLDIPVSDLIPLDREEYLKGRKVLVSPDFLERPMVVYWEVSPQDTVPINTKVTLDGALLRETHRLYTANAHDTLSLFPDSLSAGSHHLKIEFSDGKHTVTKTLVFQISGIPQVSTQDFEDFVSILAHLFPGDTLLAQMKTDDPQRRQELWQAFWKNHDPTPGTPKNELLETILSRVAYADQAFSIGKIKGRLTDRGLVYIRLGMPDEIERHPFDWDAKSYEIWYYYDINLTLIFVDRMGFGDYELYSPPFVDLFRY